MSSWIGSQFVIWMLRHGDAEDGSPDAARPLTSKGERQARAAGAALAQLGAELDKCLTSSRVRAADTARLACEALGVEAAEDERLSGGAFDPLELVAGLGADVLLVGHEPDFSEAVRALTGGRVKMKKGGLAAIDRGELRLLLGPDELARLAGH
jgi:phosphohistidine phosphatase